MEHGPFIDDFPINTSIYKKISMAMLNNTEIQGKLEHHGCPGHHWHIKWFFMLHIHWV
jgi:hypothetical protein